MGTLRLRLSGLAYAYANNDHIHTIYVAYDFGGLLRPN